MTDERPVIGIFGAGKVGTALARLLVSAGYDVALTGSPRQTALDLLVSVVAPGARVVKSLNHLGYHEMEDDAMPAGSPLRRALAVVGDDPGARAMVARVIDDLGFDAVDGGALANGRALEPGHPAFGRELSAAELAALMAEERVLVA